MTFASTNACVIVALLCLLCGHEATTAFVLGPASLKTLQLPGNTFRRMAHHGDGKLFLPKLGSPSDLSQKSSFRRFNNPFPSTTSMSTSTKREPMRMPSQTPMVPYKVRCCAGKCMKCDGAKRLLDRPTYNAHGCLESWYRTRTTLCFVSHSDHTCSRSMGHWISYSCCCYSVSSAYSPLDRRWLNLWTLMRPCIGIAPSC